MNLLKSNSLQLVLLALVSSLFYNTAHSQVKLGIDQLKTADFRPLWGKRVGLLTHPAGVDHRGITTLKLLHNVPKVRLVALFGPEHGIYGNEKANQPVLDKTDALTGLPVYSLYGKYRKPTPSMLANLDCMVIDLQDIGVRSYTYISCMRLALEACFESGVSVMILDRPNPLSGLLIDGPLLEEKWRSYVGTFPLPYLHGMTIGELAIMAKKEPGWLSIPPQTIRKGALTIIPMKGWQRNFYWPQTGLKWVPTSPYIPSLSAVLGYAMVGLGGQINAFSHGIGTPHPFRLLQYRGKSPHTIQKALTNLKIPGLSFPLRSYKNRRNQTVIAPYVRVDSWKSLRPTQISFAMMLLACRWESPKNPYKVVDQNQAKLYNKHVGSSLWWEQLKQKGENTPLELFLKKWEKEAKNFQQYSKKYWIY